MQVSLSSFFLILTSTFATPASGSFAAAAALPRIAPQAFGTLTRHGAAGVRRVGLAATVASPVERLAEPLDTFGAPTTGPAPADPSGVRVVPYRPTAAWPEGRRLHPRVYDPFRAFPLRARFLLGLIDGRDPRD
jgi:hypothetical protein